MYEEVCLATQVKRTLPNGFTMHVLNLTKGYCIVITKKRPFWFSKEVCYLYSDGTIIVKNDVLFIEHIKSVLVKLEAQYFTRIRIIY